MPDPITISANPPANPGLDYTHLKIEGTTLVQQLAGEIWTDYNEHDPGVTALEQLCYALTELSYRAELPLKDLLMDGLKKRIETRRQALFIPRRIFPCNPVTEDDYRKLIVDRVPKAANVWLTPWSPEPRPSDFVNGLYNVWIYAPGVDPCGCDPQLYPDEIRERVRRVYCRHRGLCEDLREVCILEALRTVVRAQVNILDGQRPEAILAGIFFHLGNLLAPELRRSSLKSLIEQGETPGEIFTGPLLRHGFIDDAELQPKAAEISVLEIVRAITRSPGVAGARNVSVDVGQNGKTYRGSQRIPVPEQNILRLDASPQGKAGFAIQLFKNGIECSPDPRWVERELNRLWSEYRRTHPLLPQYEEFLAVPRGQYRDLKEYYSIQNQFPNVYGINSNGLPDEATRPRRGMAKQFKGYLLVFEQLLADFFAQLAHTKDLYSTRRSLRHTYFLQYLTGAVPDVGPLLKDNYERGLQRIIYGADPVAERRSRFLDFLLALYAEALPASSTAEGRCCGSPQPENDSLVAAKLELLRYLVASTSTRSQGFNYLALPSPRNVAGMEIRIRIQLGMKLMGHRTVADVLDEHGMELAQSDAEASLGRALQRHSGHIDESFSPVPLEKEGRSAGAERPPLAGQVVAPEFVQAAASIENFRLGVLPGDSKVTLVCKAPGEEVWRLAGKYDSRERAAGAAHGLAGILKTAGGLPQQLYIVEHTLLRFAQPPQSEEDHEGDILNLGGKQAAEQGPSALEQYTYGFSITAVLSTSPGPDKTGYRTLARNVIRQNTPAHIVAQYCFLTPPQMCKFESLYWDWREALRRDDPEEKARSSRRLQEFLQFHQEARREDE